MRQNHTLAELRAGRAAVGTQVSYASPDAAEQVAHLGFDFVWLDWQHGQWTELTLNEGLARFLPVQSTPIVRVKSHEPGAINRVLDMGAMGVIVPMVQNAEQARTVVQSVYYTPLGMRSAGGMRLALIGESGPQEYFAKANDEMLLAVQIETEEAVANVASIMQVPGIDVALIGPADLMLDVKAHGHDEGHHERLVLQVAEASKQTGTAAGYVCQSREMAERRVAQGFRFISYMSDHLILMAGMRELRTHSRGW